MARDMHDILGHSLTVITVKAELAGRLFDVDPDRARAEIAEVERLSRDALADVRRHGRAASASVTLPGELAGARQAFDSAGIEADLPGSVDDVPERHARALRVGRARGGHQRAPARGCDAVHGAADPRHA